MKSKPLKIKDFAIRKCKVEISTRVGNGFGQKDGHSRCRVHERLSETRGKPWFAEKRQIKKAEKK